MKISDKHLKVIAKLLPAKEQQAFVDNALDAAIHAHEARQSNVVEVFADGGARGNPGPAGGGFVIYKGGKPVHEGKEFFGNKTNNQAEYLGLRLALREAHDRLGNTVAIHCFMDSELVVKQMHGEYRVKNAKLRPLFDEISRIANQFKHFQINHIPRAQNKRADMLANDAMDNGGN